MSQFAFVCAEGRFPIPNGESRVGSDTSCAVCVHGEGVLPVHAYLKVDGEKVLIRPFSEKAAIMLESAPVTGPQQLQHGHRVSLGPVQLQLVSERARWRFPWRACAYVMGGLAAILLVLVMLRFVWFNEGWWKAQILASIEQTLGRENAAIEKLDLFVLDGRIVVHNLTIANRDPFPEDSNVLEIPEMELSVKVWPFLSSWFREVRGGRLTLTRPLLKVERIEHDGRPLCNVEDVLANLRRRATEGLRSFAALEAEVLVNDGRLEFKDRLAQAESVLSGLTLHITQDGFEKKLAVTLQAQPGTGSSTAGGTPPSIGLSGELRLFSETGRIDPDAIGDGRFTLALNSFDLARLCQHLRWEWRVRGGEQKVVPGKPVTGEVRISFSDLKRCELAGVVESESLVSLLEPDRSPLGNIPTVVSIDRLTYDFEKGWPTELDVNLRADQTLAAARSHAEAKALVLRASLRRNATGEETFDIDLRSRLQDLCATDVGERLELKGRLEGGLKASASFVREARAQASGEGHGPQTRIRTTIELDQSARVRVPSPLPAAEGVWQELKLTATLDATAGSTPAGDVTDVKGRLSAVSDSFLIESAEDTELSSLDRMDQFSLKTKFNVKLKGREFWQQYGPVLNLFGFDRPVEEEFALVVTALSTTLSSGPRAGTRQVELGFQGTAARQWAPDPAPVSLRLFLDYYPEAFAASAQRLPQSNAPPPLPYLVLQVQTGTQQQQPYADLPDVEVTRDGETETIRIRSIVIQSNMDAFEQRFKPYLKWAGDFLGTDFLDRYRISGELEADGSLAVQRPLKRFAVGYQPFEAQFKIKAKGRDLTPSGPVFTLPAKPEEKPRRWSWIEPSPEMTIEGVYRYRPAPNKEEPDVRKFGSLNVKMQGEVGAFSFSATDLDLYLLDRLATRARAPGKSWPDTAETLQIAGTVKPAAFDFLRRLELPGLKPWLLDPVVSGSLDLNASFSRREDRAHLTKLVFKQDAGISNAFWLKELNLVARLRGVKQLANQVFGRPQGTPLESVKLFEYMSEGLVIHKLVFDAPAFAQWLATHPQEEVRENSFADFVPATLTGMLRARTLDPQGPWVLTNIGLEGIANQEQAWRVYGHFLTDFMVTLPQEYSLSRSSLAPALKFKGPWVLPEKDTARLTLSPDGNYLYLALHADLDSTELSLRNLYPAWVYQKDAKQPLQFNVDGFFPLSSKGGTQVFAFRTLALEGGPMDLRLEEGQARATPNREGRLAIESLSLKAGTIKGGPVFADARVENISYNSADDQLVGRMVARRLDVPTLARVLPRFPGWSYEGLIGEMSVDVQGTLASMLSFTLNPRQDRVRADLNCERLRITADTERGEFTRLELNGQVGLSPTRIDGKDLKVTLLHVRPGEGSSPATLSKHVVRMPQLLIGTQQVEQSLQQAFAKQPYPLQLNLPLQFETAVDVDRLAEAWQTVRKVHYKGQLPKEETKPVNPFEVLRAIRADGTLQTPSLKLKSWALDGLNIPRYSLSDLKLTVPLCAVKCAEGDLVLTAAFYDLNHPEVSHSQKFELTKAGLNALLGPGTGGYRVGGNLTVEGELQGIGVSPGSSWEGTADVHLREAVIDPPASSARTVEPQPGAAFIERLPSLARAVWQRIAGQQQLAAGELRRDLPDSAASAWNALFTANAVTLGGFGYTADRLEFEPSRLQFIISHGIAELRPSRLIGRGASLGLELSASGRVRLGDGSIDGDLAIHPLQLPADARKALRFDDWPRHEQESLLQDMTKGELALRVSGTWKDARFAFPLAELRRRLRRAMPPPPPTPEKPPAKEVVKPRLAPEDDPALPPERALLLIFDRLARRP